MYFANRRIPERVLIGLLSSLLIAATPLAARADGAVFLKGGVTRLVDTTQTIDARNRSFDENGAAYGFLFEHRTRRDIAFGFEYLRQTHDFSTPGFSQSGSAETTILQFIAKAYFRDKKDVLRPFVGIGIGGSYSQIDYDNSTSSSYDDSFGIVLQAVGGAEWRFRNISLLAELKYLWHDTDFGSYDPTAPGVFLGFGFNW